LWLFKIEKKELNIYNTPLDIENKIEEILDHLEVIKDNMLIVKKLMNSSWSQQDLDFAFKFLEETNIALKTLTIDTQIKVIQTESKVQYN
jgi:hypothetical protein